MQKAQQQPQCSKENLPVPQNEEEPEPAPLEEPEPALLEEPGEAANADAGASGTSYYKLLILRRFMSRQSD